MSLLPGHGSRALSLASGCSSLHLINLNRRMAWLSRSFLFLDALHLFGEIHSPRSPLKPDSYTLSTGLAACAKLGDGFIGRQLHSFGLKSGLISYLHVLNALLYLYGKVCDLVSLKLTFEEIKDPDSYSYTTMLSFCSRLGDLDFAFLVFVGMQPKDITAWNGMLTGCVESENVHLAMSLFRDICRFGVMFDNYTLASVLHGCPPYKLEFGMQVHSIVVKTGFLIRTSVINSLVTMYVNNGDIRAANCVFDEAECSLRDSITYNAMMSGLASFGRLPDMLQLFVEMHRGDCKPDERSLVVVLCSCFDSVVGFQAHCLAVKMGFESCSYVCNAAITMYSNCREFNASLKIFSNLKEKDVVTWNAMITSISHEGLSGTAFTAYREMQRELIQPDEFTFGSLLISTDSAMMIEMAHACIVKYGLSTNVQVINALVTVYSKLGKMKEAFAAFLSMTVRNLITWNCLLSGFITNGLPMEALKLFSNLLINCDLRPDEFSLNLAISICSALPAFRMGKQVHSYILISGFGSNMRIANNLISFYSKSGNIDCSSRIFHTMSHRDVISWNSLIAGYAYNGKAVEAVKCFEAMENLSDLKPDNVTMTSILCACTHAGLIDEGKRFFYAMINCYGIKPEIGHISAILDLLGRGGHFDEMEKLLESEHFLGHPDILLTMLNSCASHGKLELARKVAELLIRRHKDDPSIYVLLSNVYSAIGEWGEAARARDFIDDIKARKQVGYSWIGA